MSCHNGVGHNGIRLYNDINQPTELNICDLANAITVSLIRQENKLTEWAKTLS